MLDTPPEAAAPADPLLDLDLRPRLAAPGLGLGIGIAAGVIPFFIQVASTSVSSVNGRITSATYRDNLAVICGAIALAMGVFAIVSSIRKPRAARTIVGAVVLFALGGYQLAHGLGVFFDPAPDPAPAPPQRVESTREQVSPPSAPPPSAPPPSAPPAADQPKLTQHDARRIARRVFDRWHADQLDQLLDELGWQDKDVRARFHRDYEWFEDLLGKIVGPKDAAAGDDGVIRGSLVFERGEVEYSIELEDGERVKRLNLDLPDELRAKGGAGATMASADAACKKVIGAMFAGKLDRVRPLFDIRLSLDGGGEADLAALVKKAGRIKKIATREQHACNDAKGPRFCFEYEVTTTRDVVTAKLDVQMMVGRWLVQSFDLRAAKP